MLHARQKSDCALDYYRYETLAFRVPDESRDFRVQILRGSLVIYQNHPLNLRRAHENRRVSCQLISHKMPPLPAYRVLVC